MISIRPAAERGHTKIDWLDSWHSFSFGEYRDPRHMGFHSLRVINDDRFGAATGFPTHPHRDMEILTWVLAGALEHRRPQESHSPTNPGDHLVFQDTSLTRQRSFDFTDPGDHHLFQNKSPTRQRGSFKRPQESHSPTVPQSHKPR